MAGTFHKGETLREQAQTKPARPVAGLCIVRLPLGVFSKRKIFVFDHFLGGVAARRGRAMPDEPVRWSVS
jgi:hypothetical protein